MVLNDTPLLSSGPMRAFKHPLVQDLTLERVLYALSDPVRLEIVRCLMAGGALRTRPVSPQ